MKPLKFEELTNEHKTLIELNSVREALVEQLKATNEMIELQMEGIEFDQLFQNEDGTVFVVEQPAGTFVEYKTWAIKRTRRDGEESSSSRLAIKTAEDAGLVVTNKARKVKSA